MARYTSLIIATASGKVGGLVFAHNSFGLNMRKLAKPANVQSPPQTAQRTHLRIASANWRHLSPTDQASWIAYAAATPVQDRKTGLTMYISGMSMYARCANVAVKLGQPLPGTAPGLTAWPVIPAPTGSCSPGVRLLQVAFASPPPAGFYTLLYASLPQSTGKHFFRNPKNFVGYLTSASTSPTSFAIPVAPSLQQQLYCRYAYQETASSALENPDSNTFIAPTAVTCNVTSVVAYSGAAIWYFDQNILAAGVPTGLQISGVDANSILGYTSNSVTLHYTAPVSPGDPWSTVAGSGITPPVIYPASGTVL